MCLTPDPPAKLVAAHNMLKDQENANSARLMARDDSARLDIDLYLHVIETAQSNGNVSSVVVDQQVKAIVDIYSKYNIFFHYKGVDHTINDGWATSVNDSVARGQALRQGDYTALNIYIIDTLGGETLGGGGLGICEFPKGSDKIPGVASEDGGDEEGADTANYIVKDGCTIGGFTLPGGNFQGEAMEGLTAIHEIGHWLGLFHTFQGNDCDGPGDLIADTRVQSGESRGCPAHRVSCPNAVFPPTPEDPFHNYMDYSADNCTNNFTPLQLVRVFGVFPLFRVSANANATTNSTIPPLNGTISTPLYLNTSIATASLTAGPQPVITASITIQTTNPAAAISSAAAGTVVYSSAAGAGTVVPLQPTAAPVPGSGSSGSSPGSGSYGSGSGGSGVGGSNNASTIIGTDLGTCIAAVVTLTTLSCY